MTDLLTALGSIRLRDARDATTIADAIAMLRALQRDNEALSKVVEELQVELAIAQLRSVS